MDSITIRLLDPARASLDIPQTLKCTRNGGGNSRSGRWLRLRTHHGSEVRQRGVVLAAGGGEGGPSSGIDLSEAVRERLRKAQEYKAKKGGASSSAPPSAAAPSSSGPSSAGQESIVPPASEQKDEEKDAAAQPSSIAPAGFLEVESDQDKKLKEEKRKQTIVPSRVAPEPERPETSDRRLSQDDFQAKLNMGGGTGAGFRAVGLSDEDRAAAVQKESGKGRSGSSTESAGFLSDLFTEERTKELEDLKEERGKMRQEDFTVIQEEEMKSRGAEVISVDKSYQPTVSTWGVYPRPGNISETYGGGKTIDPTKPLEDEDAKSRRDKEIKARLEKYRKGVGLEIDPEVEKKFNEKYSKAMSLFKAGDLRAAYRQFDAASEVVEWATKPGGEADYYKAMCLDSLGENMKAKPMYNRLTKHPNPDVRKLSKRMLFGFSAMDNLKTHTISYKVGNAYQDYFRRVSSNYDTVYYGEDDDDNLVPLIALLALTVLPLAMVFILTQR